MRKYIFILTLLLFFCEGVKAQIVQNPVTSTVLVTPPTSTYLTDYYAAGSQKLRLNLFQNDFNEAEIQARLTISIEGNGISLTTNPNRPQVPITLTPGLNVITGAALQAYLDPANLNISGIDPNTLRQNGSGLPAGMYNFCVEVFEVTTQTALSIKSCSNAMLSKNNPPITVLPTCGGTVPKNSELQNFLLQWQSGVNAGLMSEYLLTLVQVPPNINPNDALNGAQTPLLDAKPVMGTNYNYGPADPTLDPGKVYAWRVQARDAMGTTTFENNGLSEICTFYYGFDANGPITLTGPNTAARATIDDKNPFTWNRPNLPVPALQVYYKMRLVEKRDEQTAENAIKFNTPLYETTTEVIPAGGNLVLPDSIYTSPANKNYVWQVKGFTNVNGTELAIGQSEIRPVGFAPAVAEFTAGSPFAVTVKVNNLTKTEQQGSDLKISGSGTVVIDSSGTAKPLSFSEILVTLNEGKWKLKENTIRLNVENYSLQMDNSGKESDDIRKNGDLKFAFKSLELTPGKHYATGQLEWDYPNSVTSSSKKIKSKEEKFIFNEFRLSGDKNIAMNEAEFELLDISGYRIKYTGGNANGGSSFELKDNICTLHLSGYVQTSTKLKTYQKSNNTNSSDPLQLAFADADNPYYWESGSIADNGQHLNILGNSNWVLQPVKTIFDLSETKSALKVSDEKWKGLYWPEWKIYITTKDNLKGVRFRVKEGTTFSCKDSDEGALAFADGQGLDLNFTKAFTATDSPESSMNTFPSDLKEIKLKLEDNQVKEGNVKGTILIPFVSETDRFAYIAKFDENYLHSAHFAENGGLVSKEVKVGSREKAEKGKGEKKIIDVKIKQAVFKDRDKLDLTIDAEWSHFDLKAENVRDFYIYGNGRIGFKKPNGGQSLVTQANSDVMCFGLNTDHIYAGYIEKDKVGTYAMAFKSVVSLGDDESGIAGASENGPTTYLTVLHSVKTPISDLKSVDQKNWTGKVDEGEWIDAKKGANGTWGMPDSPADGGVGFNIPISMDNSYLKFNGNIQFIGNSPDWGNMVRGVISAELPKLESPDIHLDALVGCVSNTRYWKVDLLVGGDEEDYGKNEEEDNNSNNASNTGGGPPAKANPGASGGAAPAAAAPPVNPGKAPTKAERPKNQWKWGKVIFEKIGGRFYYHMAPEDLNNEVECTMKRNKTTPMGAEKTDDLNDDGSGSFVFNAPEDYVVDKNTKWGAALTVAMRSFNEADEEKHGEKWAFNGSAAIVYGEKGGVSGLAVKLQGSKVNKIKETEIKSSALAGLVCATFEMDPFAYTVTIGVTSQSKKGQNPPLCAQGMLHIAYESGIGLKKLAIGKPSFPIQVQAKCAGPVFGGWFGYGVKLKKDNDGNLVLNSKGEKQVKSSSFELGFLLGKSIKKSWEKKYRWCGIGAEFKAGIAGSIGVRLQNRPEWEFDSITFKAGAIASVEIEFTGYWCRFGSTGVEAYLGGTLTGSFKKGTLKGELSGRLDIFGIFKPKFYLNGELKL